ncbi:hypothetical protein MNBD_GAMMA18-2185 [hydrothermal vent metagenome]|uniref:Energy-coupling factor transporter transmembrane protein EcfT n=1 Tax=hydrothermal vent metagenome TaxID=652676 RepID=A0A3B0ZL80_9ZZZZ
MHPVIKILLLLLAALMTVWGGWSQWLLALSLTVIGFTFVKEADVKKALRMMARLRWLLLSIIIIYLWFTPGTPLLPDFPGWSPSYEGVLMGLHRAAILLLLVLAVSLLLQSTPLASIIAALLWLLRPFALLGLPHERLAVRLALTMEAVDELQRMTSTPPPVTKGLHQRIRMATTRMVDLFGKVTQHAHSLPCRSIEVPLLKAPGLLQWLMLLALSGVFLIL